ncbi:MAG: hypothetical protein RJA52_155, partial [Bacteroidota bacterium]
MKTFSNFFEETKEKQITFVLVECNPPVAAHEKLFNHVLKKSNGADYRIYIKRNLEENSISFEKRLKFSRKMFPKYSRQIVSDAFDNEKQIVDNLHSEGFDRINVVSLNNNKELKEERGLKISNYNFTNPEIELEKFNRYLPQEFSESRDLFREYCKANKIKEKRNHVELPKVSEIREKYVKGNLFQVGDSVYVRSIKKGGIVTHCGSNYVMVENHDGGFGRHWLNDVE